MGLFDRFKSSKAQIGKDKKPKHVVAKKQSAKERAEEEKRRQFAAVPSAGVPAAPKAQGEVKKEAVKPVSSAKRKEGSGSAYRILYRALISEKVTAMVGRNQYAFAVAPNANKVEVSRAIVALYGVRPLKVNMLNVGGKHVRYGRTEGTTKNWKKAIVTLMPGQKLNISGT